MSKQHSILPASASERWWNCPGSMNACKDIPNPPNKYTAEGTVAHALAEQVLKDMVKGVSRDIGKLCGEIVKQDGFDIEITDEMIDAVYEYTEYIREIWESEGKCEIYFEHKVTLEEVNAVLFGTIDCVIVNPFERIHIIDFKYGAGKRVSAWENKQLMEYALGVMLKEDCTEFSLHICQPRVEDGFTRYDGTSDGMLEFQKQLEEKVVAALDPKAPLIPGDWCKQSFCPKRTSCPALMGLAHQVAAKDFSKLPVVDALSMKQIVAILDYEDTVKDWMARVRDHAKELLLQGQEIPGYKIVQAFGHSKWIDEAVIKAEFEDEFGEQLYEKKLISPAKLEKLAGKKRLGATFRDDYTLRPEAGYKIVKLEEKGEPIKNVKAEEDFL